VDRPASHSVNRGRGRAAVAHPHVTFSLAGPPDNLALTYRSVSRYCAVETGAPATPRREAWRTTSVRRADPVELCAGLRMQYGRRVPRQWCNR
jgi:hypothetical protein